MYSNCFNFPSYQYGKLKTYFFSICSDDKKIHWVSLFGKLMFKSDVFEICSHLLRIFLKVRVLFLCCYFVKTEKTRSAGIEFLETLRVICRNKINT